MILIRIANGIARAWIEVSNHGVQGVHRWGSSDHSVITWSKWQHAEDPPLGTNKTRVAINSEGRWEAHQQSETSITVCERELRK